MFRHGVSRRRVWPWNFGTAQRFQRLHITTKTRTRLFGKLPVAKNWRQLPAEAIALATDTQYNRKQRQTRSK